MEFSPRARGKILNNCSELKYASLHSVDLKILKLVKSCTIIYLSLARLGIGRVQKAARAFVEIRTQVFQGCNVFRRVVELNREAPAVWIDVYDE